MARSRRWLRLGVAAALVTTLFASPIGQEAKATPEPWTYFTMSDGTEIAAAVRYPAGFDADKPGGYPVLFSMDGYAAGGSGGISPASYNDNYITVYASIRGTGCSGGTFNLFDYRHAEDGHEIITNHLPGLPGSNGEVGIIGHSYPGLTGWLTAATNPPNLEAIAISGLIDDLYRGIVYPGGVPNYGFPAVWTGAYRPGVEVAGNAGRALQETASGDPTCAANIAARSTHVFPTVESVFENPILNGATQLEDGNWWRDHSTLTRIGGIQKPIHITQQYQDEQTGPRGGHVLFERLGEQVPKRMVITNGVHATTGVGHADRVRWLDCWILHDGDTGASASDGTPCAEVLDPDTRVSLFFESTGNSSRPLSQAYRAADWPLPAEDADWTHLFLHDDGTLSESVGSGEGSLSYVSSSAGRQMTADAGFGLGDESIGKATFVEGPDALRYELEFDEATAIAGPINLTLEASSTAVNTDFFVDILDVSPDGEVSYLQRGMQRASHREINPHPSRSDYVDDDPSKPLYRAWHPHTNTATKVLVPGQAETFEIEVFPLGHVFRAGHKLVLNIHAPPPADPLSIYAWVSGQPPALNTVFHNGASSLLLPVMKQLPPISATAPGCGDLVGVPCSTSIEELLNG